MELKQAAAYVAVSICTSIVFAAGYLAGRKDAQKELASKVALDLSSEESELVRLRDEWKKQKQEGGAE